MLLQPGDTIQHRNAKYAFWIVLIVDRGQVFAKRVPDGRRRWIMRPEFYHIVEEPVDAEPTLHNSNV